MRSDITIGEGPEDRVAQRVKSHIAVGMGSKTAVVRDADAGQHDRPAAIAEFVNVEPGTSPDVGDGCLCFHLGGSFRYGIVAGEGRQNGKIPRRRQLPEPFVTGDCRDPAAIGLDKLDVVGDFAAIIMRFIKRLQMRATENLWCLCPAKTGARCGACHPVVFDALQRVGDGKHGKGGHDVMRTALFHRRNQAGDDALRQQWPCRVMNGHQRCVVCGQRQPGAHRILAAVSTGGDQDPFIASQIADRGLGGVHAGLGGDHDHPLRCRMLQERFNGVRKHRFSGEQAELFFNFATHAGAATGRDDDGGQACFGCGGHNLALSIAPLSPMPVGKSIGYRPILIGKPDPGLWVCGAAKWPKWLAILPVFGAICPKFQQPVSGLRRRVA